MLDLTKMIADEKPPNKWNTVVVIVLIVILAISYRHYIKKSLDLVALKTIEHVET